MLGELTAVLTATKSAVDITKTLMALKKGADVQAKVMELNTVLFELQQKLLEAQQGQFQLSERNRELERQIQAADDWKTEKARYQLYEFPTGTLAMCIAPSAQGSEPLHYLCATCFQKGSKSIMQARKNILHDQLICNDCKLLINILDRPFPEPEPTRHHWK